MVSSKGHSVHYNILITEFYYTIEAVVATSSAGRVLMLYTMVD